MICSADKGLTEEEIMKNYHFDVGAIDDKRNYNENYGIFIGLIHFCIQFTKLELGKLFLSHLNKYLADFSALWRIDVEFLNALE